MSKKGRAYWYDYLDIDRILQSNYNHDFFYHIEDTASQDSAHAVQRISNSFAILQEHIKFKAAMIPINLGTVVNGVYQGSHWVGLVIRRNPQNSNNLAALYNDSLGQPMDTSLPALRQILNNHGIPDERITDFKQIQQENGYDCGPWTVLNLNSFARTGKLPTVREDDVIDQRKREFGDFDKNTSNSNIKHGKIVLKNTKAYKVHGELFNDEESVNKDISDGLDEFKNLKIGPQNYIKFIINVPMYVPLNDMSDVSSDESEDGTFAEEKFNFNLEDKRSLPYRTFSITEKTSKNKKTPHIKKQTITHRTGLLESNFSGDRDVPYEDGTESKDSSIAEKQLELLDKGGFDESDKKYIGNIAVSIGLNRPLSLSTRKNNCLKKELHKTEKSKIQYKKAAFFWDMPWTDKGGKSANYTNVKKFYKQLKKTHPEKAENFLKINEEEYKPSPPYQYIREYLKEHQNTKDLVQSLKTENSVVYFSSIDSDTKSFNGIYSSYLKIIEDSKSLPTVMSTGYEFAREYGFPLYVGSKLERIIRIVTASILSGGVYYPEPNFCVLIPDGNKTLPYSFVNKKMSSSNLESPVLLRQVLKKSDWVFSERGPLINAGDRAQKSGIKFSNAFQNGEAPNGDDLDKLSQIIQSTANPRDWALGVYYNRCFTIKGSTGLFNGYISNLFNNQNIENVLAKLRTMVIPSTTVDLLYKAVQKVGYVLDKFCAPFEEGKIQNDALYQEIRAQFYHLRSHDIITIIDLLETDELYNALNGGYALYEICKLSQNSPQKFKVLFSAKSREIHESAVNVLEDITYEDLEELYDRIIQYGDNTEDFETLLLDSNGLFCGEYGHLGFNEISYKFLSFFNPPKNISDSAFDNDIDNDDNLENDASLENESAYNCSVDYFRSQFEQDYGDEEQGSEQEDDDTTYLSMNNITEQLLYPVGSYENFQQSILRYQNKLFHLPGANFIAASNLFHVPGARNKVIKQLGDFHNKLKDDLYQIISYDTFAILQSCPKEFLPYFGFDSTYMASIDNIQRQISDVSDLQNLLRDSLECVPENVDDFSTGSQSTLSDDIDSVGEVQDNINN